MTQTDIRLFATDLDGTLLGDEPSLRSWRATWRRLDPGQRPLLAYTSGRLLNDVKHLVENGRLALAKFIARIIRFDYSWHRDTRLPVTI